MKYLILAALLLTGCAVTNPICLFACKVQREESQVKIHRRLGECVSTVCNNGACESKPCDNDSWKMLEGK